MPTSSVSRKPQLNAQLLCHYTNLSGLVGIIGNSKFWASNVSYLNDKKELIYGIEGANKSLVKLAEDKSITSWHDAIKETLEKFNIDSVPNTYAICFCARRDLLSQWRGYGGTEQGVCLIFHRKELIDHLSKYKAKYTPITYGQSITTKQIETEFQKFFHTVGAKIAEKIPHEKRVEYVKRYLYTLIPRFKHRSFDSEAERRFIVQVLDLGEDVLFRAQKNVIIPYIEIGDSNERLPLHSVMVGPGSDIELTERSVKTFLQAKEYEVPVIRSNVPFRG